MLHFPTEITGIMNRYKIELVGYIFSFQLIAYNGQADYWWLRSPDTYYDFAYYVKPGGDVDGSYVIDHVRGSYGPALRTPVSVVMRTVCFRMGSSAMTSAMWTIPTV